MSNEPSEMGTPYKLMTEDEVMQVKVLVSSLRAENAKLRDDLATLDAAATGVAKSGGDALTAMAHAWQAEAERLRAENHQLRAENDMLFTRAAKRLATIKELQAGGKCMCRCRACQYCEQLLEVESD